MTDEERRLKRNAARAKWRTMHPGAHAAEVAKWRKEHLIRDVANRAAWRKERPNYTIQWLKKNPDYFNQYHKTRNEKRAGRVRSNVCEVCELSGQICFDHCHITGIFRGWLCQHCNTVLGFTKDSGATLEALANYLERPISHTAPVYKRVRNRKTPAKCEVCKLKGKICFDHCHDSGRFRGWLCNNCNAALGYARNSPGILRKLAKYLSENRSFIDAG